MWPSTNIINSLKHIIHEIKELNYNIYTYIHKRQTYILKMQFRLKYRGRANGLSKYVLLPHEVLQCVRLKCTITIF